MKRSVLARYLLGVAGGASLTAAVGAFFLIATTKVAAAKKFTFDCSQDFPDVVNRSEHAIPHDAPIVITVCDRRGCAIR